MRARERELYTFIRNLYSRNVLAQARHAWPCFRGEIAASDRGAGGCIWTWVHAVHACFLVAASVRLAAGRECALVFYDSKAFREHYREVHPRLQAPAGEQGGRRVESE